MPAVPLTPDSFPLEIDVQTFAQRCRSGLEQVQLIDVREPWEVEQAAIAGFINLPLSAFEQWAPKIHQLFDAEVETIVMCHHGIRSAQMCQWLHQQGFACVRNLVGGIDAFAIQVDDATPRY